MSQQLTFDLPSEPALGLGDFFISPSNAAAVEAIQCWHDWPQGKMVLVGPEGSGKSHLAHVWSAMCSAEIVSANQIVDRVEELALRPVVVEDADVICGDQSAEQALFHLHNLALAEHSSLLVTASKPPAQWDLSLPDLKSRMQGTAMVSLTAPDDVLLTAILAKLFADRQLSVGPDVLPYLLARMERSFVGLQQLVEALDQAALREKRGITKRLAGEVLDKLGADGA